MRRNASLDDLEKLDNMSDQQLYSLLGASGDSEAAYGMTFSQVASKVRYLIREAKRSKASTVVLRKLLEALNKR